MNRRGFLGFLSKLIVVGSTIGVAPELLKPVRDYVIRRTLVMPDGTKVETVATFKLAA